MTRTFICNFCQVLGQSGFRFKSDSLNKKEMQIFRLFNNITNFNILGKMNEKISNRSFYVFFFMMQHFCTLFFPLKMVDFSQFNCNICEMSSCLFFSQKTVNYTFLSGKKAFSSVIFNRQKMCLIKKRYFTLLFGHKLLVTIFVAFLSSFFFKRMA